MNLLPEGNAYSISYVNHTLVLDDGTNTESYASDAVIRKCSFWSDAEKGQWYDWDKTLSVAKLIDGGLNLHPLYVIYVPEEDGVREWYEISCVPVLVTVEETGELFCLSLPAGATLNCKLTDGTTVQWVVNGEKADAASAGHGILTCLTLSVTKAE